MCILNDIGRIIPVITDMMMLVAVIFMQRSKQMLIHPCLSISVFFLALSNFICLYDTISCQLLTFVFLIFLSAILSGAMSFFISVTLFLNSKHRRKHQNLETMVWGWCKFSDYNMCDEEAMEQAAQWRDWGHPIPGSIQGQVGWGLEQPDLVSYIPVRGRVFGTITSLRSLATLTILQFYNSTNYFPYLLMIRMHIYIFRDK